MIKKIEEHISIYGKIFQLNIKSLLIYKLDFVIGIIAMIIKTIIRFSVILILFNLITNINGWTLDQILFLYGFSMASFSVWHCFFINTITIPIYIKTGELDRFLLYPYNPLFLIISEGFDEDGWGELIFAYVIMIIALKRLDIDYALWILIPFINIITSLVYAGISILLSIVSFLTINNTDLTDLTMDINEFAKYPISIYPKIIKLLFIFVLPIGIASFYPSLIFIREVNIYNILFLILSMIGSILFFIISFKIWMRALSRYTSAGF